MDNQQVLLPLVQHRPVGHSCGAGNDDTLLSNTARRNSSVRSLSETEDLSQEPSGRVSPSSTCSSVTSKNVDVDSVSKGTPLTASTYASSEDSANRKRSSSPLDPLVAFLFPSFTTGDDRMEVLWSACKKRSATAAGLETPCDKRLRKEFQTSVSELVDESELLGSKVTLVNPNPVSDVILKALPREVLDHCLSFLDPVRDRASTSRTCKLFRTIMTSPHMMRKTDLFGVEDFADDASDFEPVKTLSFVHEDENTQDLLIRLKPYLEAENLSAMYIMGMILIYCHDDVQTGMQWLEAAAECDHDEALYALGIITRDAQRERSMTLMERAHKLGFFPATMEVMNARGLREAHGEPTAEELRAYLGPSSLNRLMRKYFCDFSKFRSASSSHCWNPLCGRWAYKYPREQVMALASQNQESCSLKCARMKMCSSCRRAKYCSKICQVYDWRSGRHKLECQFIG